MEYFNPRLIAYYLPQFHPIPENDDWWGKGFTEWTNTAKAKPLYAGHYQPHIPADLGFYDLRLDEVREAQANLARAYGIEGFCYYHYWFGNGRRLLERPFHEVLRSKKPDFPFCLCWANESWTGVWHGADNRVLIQQEYPGMDDDEMHFNALLPAFKDKRYMCVDDKPIFLVYRPNSLPDPIEKLKLWRKMAHQAGLPGLHFVGVTDPRFPDPEKSGFDASIFSNSPPLRPWGTWKNPYVFIRSKFMRMLGIPTIYSYEESIKYFIPDSLPLSRYPSVIHAWDNSPRSGARGLVLDGSNPNLFGKALRKAFELTRRNDRSVNDRLIFLKSWNEWAEGNHLEPDLRDGHKYLKTIKDELIREKLICNKIL